MLIFTKDQPFAKGKMFRKGETFISVADIVSESFLRSGIALRTVSVQGMVSAGTIAIQAPTPPKAKPKPEPEPKPFQAKLGDPEE
jgi:hypothetical protein